MFLVSRTDAVRLCREEGHEEVTAFRAVAALDRLGRRDMTAVRGFLARARPPAFTQGDTDDASLLASLRTLLRAGALAVIREGGYGGGPQEDTDVARRRLVREIDSKSGRRLSHNGRHYRLVADSQLHRLPQRESYEVVSRREAVPVVHALANGSNAPDLAKLLNEAAGMLTPDWRPPMRPDGLILLRKIVVQQAYRPILEAALTPSQLKKLAQSDWIEFEVVDQDGEPYATSYRLDLTDKSVREGNLAEDGFLGVYEIESGTCKVVLGCRKTPAGADAAASATPAAAQANTPSSPAAATCPIGAVTPVVAAPAAELPASEPVCALEEKEFSVKVVDEANQPIAGVPMVFRWPGGKQTVPTGGDGVAKSKAAVEAAEVEFESAESLSKIVSPVWETRASTPAEPYPAVSGDVIAVTSRPAAIELPDGGEFRPLALEPGKSKTLSIWPAKKQAIYVGVHHTWFRNDSAVVNPEGEAPAKKVGEHESLTTVGVVATTLRYNEEHSGKVLFLAGHTDRAGGESDNDNLSNQRGKAMLALIEGDKAAFVAACKAKNSEVDVTQLMDWTNLEYGFSCKPTVMDAAPSSENYYRFRTSYNNWVNGPLEPDELGPRGTAIGPTGRLLPDIWEAMFDLYEHNLRQELGEDESGVASLRQAVHWVDPSKKYIGHGERHPTVAGTADDTRSDADRRVEVIFFDEQEAPNLAATNGEDIYDPNLYESQRVPPMVSAKRWTATWEVVVDPANGGELPAKLGEIRKMLLDAPGLPADEPMAFTVEELLAGGDPKDGGSYATSSTSEHAEQDFDAWFDFERRVRDQSAIIASPPKLSFRFSVSGGGRLKRSAELAYADRLDVRVVHVDENEHLEQAACRVLTPWGVLVRQTTSDGSLVVEDLAPGGCRVTVGDAYRTKGNV